MIYRIPKLFYQLTGNSMGEIVSQTRRIEIITWIQKGTTEIALSNGSDILYLLFLFIASRYALIRAGSC
jgi:hypothetical protein